LEAFSQWRRGRPTNVIPWRVSFRRASPYSFLLCHKRYSFVKTIFEVVRFFTVIPICKGGFCHQSSEGHSTDNDFENWRKKIKCTINSTFVKVLHIFISEQKYVRDTLHLPLKKSKAGGQWLKGHGLWKVNQASNQEYTNVTKNLGVQYIHGMALSHSAMLESWKNEHLMHKGKIWVQNREGRRGEERKNMRNEERGKCKRKKNWEAVGVRKSKTTGPILQKHYSWFVIVITTKMFPSYRRDNVGPLRGLKRGRREKEREWKRERERQRWGDWYADINLLFSQSVYLSPSLVSCIFLVQVSSPSLVACFLSFWSLISRLISVLSAVYSLSLLLSFSLSFPLHKFHASQHGSYLKTVSFTFPFLTSALFPLIVEIF
jgi:hypothetical protein